MMKRAHIKPITKEIKEPFTILKGFNFSENFIYELQKATFLCQSVPIVWEYKYKKKWFNINEFLSKILLVKGNVDENLHLSIEYISPLDDLMDEVILDVSHYGLANVFLFEDFKVFHLVDPVFISEFRVIDKFEFYKELQLAQTTLEIIQ